MHDKVLPQCSLELLKALEQDASPLLSGWTLAGGAYSLTGGFWVGGETSTPPVCRGDSNCDGVVSWRDIDYFVAAMNDNVAAWHGMFAPSLPACQFENNDVNADGTVNWRDIDPLVAVMNTICP